jgi:hypothetical protein
MKRIPRKGGSMTADKTSGASRESRRTGSDLDSRYGRIAISAVVAALPYCSDSKAAPESLEDRRDRAA